MYSTIALIWHARTGLVSDLSVPLVTEVLTRNYLLLPLNLGWTINQSIPGRYFLLLLVHSHQGPLLFFMESSQLKNLV